MGGFNFKSLIPAALGMGANFLVPGSGALVGPLASAALQGGGNKKISKANQEWERAQYIDQLRYGRRNMTDASGGTLTNTQDPTTGAWESKTALGPEQQQRRDIYNQIGLSRMNNAAQVKLPDLSQGINYRSWQMPKYGSPGGDFGASSLGMGRG